MSATQPAPDPLLPVSRFGTSAGDLAFTDVGEGPVVVLLHAVPLSRYEWRRMIPLFASRFRVIAPDLLGAGDSDKPAGAPLHIRAQAGYVSELLAGLGVERFAVVGHGLGGGVAQLLALDGSGVEAMVLIDSVAFDRWPAVATREARDRLAEEPPDAGRMADLVRDRLEAAAETPLPGEVVDAYVAPFSEEPVALLRALDAIDGRGLAGREPELERIEFPVLILWGEEDPLYPPDVAEALNAAMPSSALGLLPGCGHLLVDEAAETIGPMIAEYLRARWLHAPHAHGDPSGAVMLQLERRPPWVDLADDEADDWFDEGVAGPATPDPADQEVGKDARR